MSTNIYSIYKATNNINGKCYIGFDSNWPSRFNHHKRTLDKTKFHNAIRKYGWDNFEWEIIYQSFDGNHCLNVMENHFIKEYNSFNNGYNMTLGGEGVLGLTKVISNMTKQNIKHSLLNFWENNFSQKEKYKQFILNNGLQKQWTKIKNVNDWLLITPNGDHLIINNLKQYCKNHNLSYTSLNLIANNGRKGLHKGYNCFKL